jgi:5-methylcytosine-specific restriction protein B
MVGYKERSHLWLLSLLAGISYATETARWNLGLGLRSAIAFQHQSVRDRVSCAESLGEMSNTKVVSWGDVAYAARIAFAESVYEWEALEWTWQAWEILIQAGLATYSSIIELYEVVIRFFAILTFYFDFYDYLYCKSSLETREQFNYITLLEYLDFTYISTNKLILYAVVSIPFYETHKYKNNTPDNNDKLLFLIDRALEKVIPALIEGFGSNSRLLKSLWQITNPAIGEHEPEIDESEKPYRDYCFYRADVERMNEAKMMEKIEALAEEDNAINEENEEDEFYETDSYFFNSSMSADNISLLSLNTSNKVKNYNNALKYFFEGEIIDDVFLEQKDFSNSLRVSAKQKPNYSLSRCANKTGFDKTEIERCIKAINRKKQAILYGSPGTGKTYLADKIAKYLIGGMDIARDGFLELVQFHPAYAYEDFIQGIRPQARPDGRLDYQIVPGRFLEFCKKAESREGLCVLIIDEINRANLTQVFGELMYLLEYRNKKICLAGSSEPFSIPENVRIIGTMNTADRSIALVDHALRRRFAFIELRPNYDVLRRYHEKNETGFQVDGLIETLERLNKAIANKHYEIGISFFLTKNLTEELEDIWKMEIEPYLEEYFYDQLDKVDEFRWDKIKQ